MKCPNCDKDMKKLDETTFYCGTCKEFYREKEQGGFKTVDDKEKVVKEMQEKFNKTGEFLKELIKDFVKSSNKGEGGLFGLD